MSQSKCNSCNSKGLSNQQIALALLGTYILISSIYGTIKIVQNIFLLF